MNVPFVDLKKQYASIKDEIDLSIRSVVDSGSFIGGKTVNQFEESFAEISGSKHCIGVTNGTDALFIVLKSLGITTGHEVITTAQSWISTSQVISLTGATPIFVDISSDHLIDPDLIENKISEKTKAIIPVHLYGQMADIVEIERICKKHDLHLIEDSAQAHLAQRNGIKAGTTGIAGTFSFYPSKNLGAYGNAGAITTNDDELANKVRMFSRNGGLVKHSHHIEGMNSRLDNMQAAILSAKLPYLKQWTEARRVIANTYREALKDIAEIQLPIEHNDSFHVYHLFVILTKNRDQLKINLAAKGIGTAIHYPNALPFLKCYEHRKFSPRDYPTAYTQSKQTLSLPMYPELTEDEQAYVISQIRSFYKKAF